MPSNIEVKARYPDLSRAREICRRIGARFEGVLNQTDTYFRVEQGRLKLRQINNERSELIEYTRPNIAAARSSLYTVTPVLDPTKTLADLTQSHGVLCVVKKHRELFLWHNVRIHLDEVAGLGSYIEFEGVVSPDADEQISRQRVDELVNAFGITPEDQVGVSYSDLLVRSRRTDA